MRKVNFFTSLILLVLIGACTSTKAPEQAKPEFNTSLTQKEASDGLLTPEILWKFGRVGTIAISPDGKIVLYTVTIYDIPTEARRTVIYSIPAEGGDPVLLTPDGGSSPQWISDGKKIAYTSKGSLWVMNADGSSPVEVSGLENFENWAISPTDNKIWFTRRVKLDETPNEKYNLDKANMRIIDDLMYRHWDYWHDYSYSHLFVASFDGKSVNDEKDFMLDQRFETPLAPYFDGAEIAWNNDGKTLAYTCKLLNGKADAVSTNSDIFLLDTETGGIINITNGAMGYDKVPVFSPGGTKIAYMSMEEAGYESDLERLMVYDIPSGSSTWASKGWDFDVSNFIWLSEDQIVFTSPYLGTQQVFTIDLNSSEVKQITSGVHDIGPLTLGNGVLAGGKMSMSSPTEVVRIDMGTGQIAELTNVNAPIFEKIKMGKVEERYIKTKDKKDLQMWVIYPPDFDPAKKYPALLYCKGGPQGALGQGWSYRWNYQIMAANGYIVVAPNRRGNSGFGSEWTEQISGDYGGLNMQDYLDAIDAMAEEPFVDKERLGAVGASYGGYSVFYLAGIHNGRFKALISHCGMFNFESWYGTTEELWFANKDIEGPYWEKPKSYDYSPHLLVDKWTAPIMIITGEQDYRIPYTQSMEAFQAAQLRGIPSRLLFFHDGSHFVTNPHDAIIWQKEFFRWLDTYLKIDE